MNKKTYFINGTHCRSCELLIEDKMLKIPGVKKARVNYRTGKMDLFSDSQVPEKSIETEIRNAGYSLGSAGGPRPLLAKDIATYVELLFAGSFLLFLYFILKSFGALNLNLSFSNSPSMAVVVLIGLTAGVSTCMALVGGLVLGVAARHSELHPEATGFQKLKPNLLFLNTILFFFHSCLKPGVMAGLIIETDAPHSKSRFTLRSATDPAPTTRHLLFSKTRFIVPAAKARLPWQRF